MRARSVPSRAHLLPIFHDHLLANALIKTVPPASSALLLLLALVAHLAVVAARLFALETFVGRIVVVQDLSHPINHVLLTRMGGCQLLKDPRLLLLQLLSLLNFLRYPCVLLQHHVFLLSAHCLMVLLV